MSRDLKPYIGRVGTGISAPTIWKLDSGTTDAATTYQATVKTKAYTIKAGENMGMLEDAYLLGEAASGVTITLTVDRDFGLETSTATALLTAAGSESRVFPKFEGAAVSQAAFLQFQVGDGSAVDNTWTLDAIVTPLQTEDPR